MLSAFFFSFLNSELTWEGKKLTMIEIICLDIQFLIQGLDLF